MPIAHGNLLRQDSRKLQKQMTIQIPRGIAVVDVGFSNCKVILYDENLAVLAERKIASPHHDGPDYKEIGVTAIMAFATGALRELDRVMPIDVIVPCAHGACIVALKADGTPSVPVMDYMSEPPPEISEAYKTVVPSFAESLSPLLPMALLHAMQLFWQNSILPHEFAKTTTILPLMQYIAFMLGAKATSEVSSMSCQSHLVDMQTGGPSSLARQQGWAKKFAPLAKAWEVIGVLSPALRGPGFRGHGTICAGVHDSNANYLRYLAADLQHFTLLSTGTWIICFDTDADIARLDPARDIVANKDVFGRTVACSRFFGGKEFEILSSGASPEAASLQTLQTLVSRRTFALPSYSDSGGPLPDTGGKGHIVGPPPETETDRASLAALYCAQMVSVSLDFLTSQHDIIVDGPFAQNGIFLSVLAALRPGQSVRASTLTDGTAAGAACLALMPNGLLPHLDISMRQIAIPDIVGLAAYQRQWKQWSAVNV